MQNTCNWDSYALTLREEMSSYLSENPVYLIKKRTMITPVPKQKSKKPTSVRSRCRVPHVRLSIVAQRPKDLYYSLLFPSVEKTDAYITIVSNARKDILRITMVCMVVYESYLFALGLPYNFPKEQIIVFWARPSQIYSLSIL
ncbi:MULTISPECIES: hypothetical protein [Sphingobacterium]|uniref:hypothetical protein n=1 Tax=Sphingobacterium TaxID=28453 RepID=UPI0025E3B7CA|nr:hypothetical protein [Sphingobacterium sp. UBA6320]